MCPIDFQLFNFFAVHFRAAHSDSDFCAIASPNILTSPAGAVAKYCDEYVYVCVGLSVCLSVHEDISRTTVAIFANFSVHVACVRGSVLLRQGHEISRGRDSFAGFLPQRVLSRSLQKRSFHIGREGGGVYSAGEV